MGTFARRALALAALLTMTAETATAQVRDDAQLKRRDEYILGKPVRIAPVPIESLTEQQREMTAPPPGYGRPGELPEHYRILLHVPELLKAFSSIGTYFLVHGKMSVRDRELVVLRVGWLTQAPYEWGEHVNIGKTRAGLTSEEIGRVKIGSSAPGWSDHDRALLKAVDELFDDAMITDATWETLARSMTNEQLVELPVLVGQYKTVAFMQNSWRISLRDTNVGMTAK